MRDQLRLVKKFYDKISGEFVVDPEKVDKYLGWCIKEIEELRKHDIRKATGFELSSAYHAHRDKIIKEIRREEKEREEKERLEKARQKKRVK